LAQNAIIVHGKPPQAKFENPELLDPSDSNWLPWAKRQLTLRGIFAVVPDMPKPYDPIYEDWAQEFERHDVTEETILIGHSAGAGFLVRWMSEHNKQAVRSLILVAPWIDPNKKYGDFARMDAIDPTIPSRCMGSMAIFFSSLDDGQAQASHELLVNSFPGVKNIDIPEYGHFMVGNNMTSVEFPELLEELTTS
jgi:uncharacterized protein